MGVDKLQVRDGWIDKLVDGKLDRLFIVRWMAGWIDDWKCGRFGG